MGLFNDSSKHDFNLEIVHSCFRDTLKLNDRVSLENYLLAFHELCRFFKLTGRLFAFVAKDLEYKIQTIENHMSSDSDHYETVDSMVEYEKDQGKTHAKGSRPSGCRMLLRLHWALEFILAFMEKLLDEEEDAKASKIAWEVYKQTLYHHHPWITRQLASVAVFALPSKKHLINVMCKQEFSHVETLVQDVLTAAHPVHSRVGTILKDSDLLAIP